MSVGRPRMMSSWIWIGAWFIAFAMVSGVTSAMGAIIYVDDSAPAGGNGSSWSTAYQSLRAALANSSAGDEVRVGKGTYRATVPGGNRAATFRIRNGVIVQGGYAGFGANNPDKLKPSKFKTILSGDLNADDASLSAGDFTNYGENSFHVVTFSSNVTPATELRGVTIRGGSADAGSFTSPHSQGGGIRCVGAASPTLVKCVIDKNRAMWNGGGVSAAQGSPTLISCKVRRNAGMLASSQGAGVFSAGGTFDRCRFIDNQGGIASTGGGAINGTTIAVVNCEFNDNGSAAISCGDNSTIHASEFTGNGAEDGGAVFIYGQNVELSDCVFEQNAAASFGGAVYTIPGASAKVVNCQFFGNHASDGNALANRGQLMVVNCLFSGNAYSFGGGGNGALSNNQGDLSIINSTIMCNESSGPGAGVFVSSGMVSIANSILWDNAGELPGEHSQIYVHNGSLSIEHCCVEGWTGALGGSNNAGHDPKLVDSDGEDNVLGTPDDNGRLKASSPCRDVALAALLPGDDCDLDDDGDTTETLPVDLDFNARVSGDGLDMGAYEF